MNNRNGNGRNGRNGPRRTKPGFGSIEHDFTDPVCCHCMCRCLFTPNPHAWDAMSDWIDVYEVYPSGVWYDNPASFSPVSQHDNIYPEIFGECCTCNENSGCKSSCEMYCLYFYKNPSNFVPNPPWQVAPQPDGYKCAAPKDVGQGLSSAPSDGTQILNPMATGNQPLSSGGGGLTTEVGPENLDFQSIVNQIQTPLSATSGNTEEQTGWNYTQSQYQLMFFFSSDIINITTNPNDVIGVFKGDICLGWRYADFTEQYIDVPMMLKDPDIVSNLITEDQCTQLGGFYNNDICTVPLCETTGTCDYPPAFSTFYPDCTFKYYNSITGEISNLVNTDAYPILSNTELMANSFIMLHDYFGTWNLEPDISECNLSYTLSSDSAGYNLVSFPFTLPEGNSLDSFFGINGPVYELIGGSIAASLIEGVQWAGSIAVQGIDPKKGYWVKQTQPGLQLNYFGECLPHDTIYDLNYGNNLISFPGTQSKSAIEVLSGKQDVITGVIGQGVAITWHDDHGWIGSLEEFEPGKGYWIETSTATEFSFTPSQIALSGESMTYMVSNFELTPSSQINQILEDMRTHASNITPNGIKRKKPIDNGMISPTTSKPRWCHCQCEYTPNPDAGLSGWMDMFSAYASYDAYTMSAHENPYPEYFGDTCTSRADCFDVCNETCLYHYKNPENYTGPNPPWQLHSYKCDYSSGAWYYQDCQTVAWSDCFRNGLPPFNNNGRGGRNLPRNRRKKLK